MGVLAFLYIKIQRINNQLASKNETIAQNAKDLGALNQTKDKLMSIIAHDLRTPFNALMGVSELMQSDLAQNDLGAVQRSFKSIHDTSKNAYYLFEDLLGWAKMQSNKLQINPDNLNLAVLVEEECGILESSINAKQLSIDSNLEELWVLADSYTLRTVFRNLLSNAVKFSPVGHSISIQSKIEKEGKLIVSIKNEGQPMEESQLEQIFEEEQWTKREGNAGLGLMFCKEFVELNMGQIDVKSNAAGGTIFSFSLPIGKIQNEQIKSNQPPILSRKKEAKGLSLEAKNLLDLYLPKLEALDFFETSDILKLTKELRTHNDLGLMSWIEQLELAVISSNKELYQQLLKDYK
ncbi:MAG: HAMP domain-containing histidine kinase [Aureispira sp.]|nr:HAMP domain-containing histidine kinase [Aureispira sp.]